MAATRRFPWWVYWVVLALLVILMVAPIIVTAVAAGIAQANGCSLSEGLQSVCLIDGVDHGRDLMEMGVAFWLVLFTFPLGLMFIIVWAIVLFFHRRGWRRTQAPEAVA